MDGLQGEGSPMVHLRRVFVRHGPSLLILAACLVAVGLTAAIDDNHRLFKRLGNRYRFHAIPVALSQLYHGRDHDYTGYKSLAIAFQGPETEIDDLITKYANPKTPVGDETYFWTADDRGLSDYVALAFQLNGPNLRSLSQLYFLLLGASVVLFAIGYWRNHLALSLMIPVVLGILFLSISFQFRAQVPLVDGHHWLEEISLFESRIFEAALVPGMLAHCGRRHFAWTGAGSGLVGGDSASGVARFPLSRPLVLGLAIPGALLHCRGAGDMVVSRTLDPKETGGSVGDCQPISGRVVAGSNAGRASAVQTGNIP